tara:strand:+ start:103 stop:663 length:561 start_codon:yes stop_codon:yes gene_type:complete
MAGLTLGDYYINIQTDTVPFYYYHRAVYWPDWVSTELPAFQKQVIQMSSKSKPLKITNTAKLQMGYPHEVELEHKQKLHTKGIQQDRTVSKKNLTIPKLTLSHLQHLWLEDNLMTVSTPTNSRYLRDVTVVDTETNESLVFCYVVSRRGHVLTAWGEEKTKGGNWHPKTPRNFDKLLSLQTKPLNN